MSSSRFFFLLPFFFCAVLAPAPAATPAPQAGERDPQVVLDRYRQYLVRKPYADFAFDKMVEAAVQGNQLPGLLQSYRDRLEQDPADLPSRIVLARLLAREGEVEEALGLLREVEQPEAELLRLVGSLCLKLNDFEGAAAALDAAAEATTDRRLLGEIHRARGEARLALGDRAGAVTAFRQVAEQEPGSFALRLEIAELFVLHGLHEEALEEFERAEAAAGDDAARRCQVLAARGRLHEQRLELPAAVAIYRRALALMGRGNWLKRELHERLVAMHRRSGQMEQLLALCRQDVAADAADLDAREFLARVLRETGAEEEARQVLAAAVADFPADLELSASLITALRALDDTEAVIAEYQRILGERPEELELYLELGEVFAGAGQWEQAKRQWQRTLQERLDDANLCLRLAGMYAYYDQREEAVAMYERAIELQPREIGHYADLAAFLLGSGDRDAAATVLERATAAAAGDGSALEQVGILLREHGRGRQALEALAAAAELRRDDPRLLSLVADLELELGELESAVDRLHQVVELARDPNLRRSSLQRVVRLRRQRNESPLLEERERAAIESAPDSLAPYLILAELYSQERSPSAAVAVLQQLLQRQPDQVDALDRIARLYEEQGEFALALETYQLLVEKAPAARRSYLKKVARLYLDRSDQDAAFAAYQRILRESPDNPAAFREVAEAYHRLGLDEERVEHLRQAVRLSPADARMRLELAQAYQGQGDFVKAEEELLTAIRSEDEDQREKARGQYYELLSAQGRIDPVVDELRQRIDDNPYDVESPLALTDIYVRELEYELALETLERLLSYQPKEPRLLAERARLRAKMQRYELAIEDYEVLMRLPDADRDDLALKIVDAALEAGMLARAEEVARTVRDLPGLARLFRKHDLLERAADTLRRAVAQSPSNPSQLRRLAAVEAEAGDFEQAAASYEKAMALAGDDWRTIEALGLVYQQMGRKEDVIDLGAHLFSMIRIQDDDEENEDEDRSDEFFSRSSRNYYGGFSYSRYYGRRGQGYQRYSQSLNRIQTFFNEKGERDAFLDLARQEMALQPRNPALLQSVRQQLMEQKKPEEAIALIRQVQQRWRQDGRPPEGKTELEWEDDLEGWRMDCYRREQALQEQRAAELQSLVDSGAGDEAVFVELVTHLQGLQRQADADAVIRTGLERLPDSPRLLAALAERQQQGGDFAAAAETRRRLVEELADNPDDEELARRRENSFRHGRWNTLRTLPAPKRRQLTDADLRRVWELLNPPRAWNSWKIGGRMSRLGALHSYASTLARAGSTEEAVAVFESLLPKDPDDLLGLLQVGRSYEDAELFPQAKEVYQRCLDLNSRLERDPLLGFYSSRFHRRLRQAQQGLALLLEKEGEKLAAYDLRRESGDTSQGKLLLIQNQLLPAAIERYLAEVDRAEAALGENPGPFERGAFRNAGIKLAEIYQFEKHWDDALAVYQRLAEKLPDSFELRTMIARLHERARRVDEAIAEHYRIIDAKREANRRFRRPADVPQPVLLQPSLDSTGNRGMLRMVWSSFGRSSSYSSSRRGAQLHQVGDNYMAILKLYVERKEFSEAAGMLRRLAQDDARSFGWMRWEIRRFLQDFDLGAESLPILRLLHASYREDEDVALLLGRTLIATEEYQEAEKVLGTVAYRRSVWEGDRDNALSLIDRIHAKLGQDREAPEDLERQIAEDPKNVKLRLRLVRRLFENTEYERACVEALALEELAPHMDEVADLALRSLRLAGRKEEVMARLKEKHRRAQDEDTRFLALVEMADLAREMGTLDTLEDLFEKNHQALLRGNTQYSMAGWFYQRGDTDRALALLTDAQENMTQTWYRDRLTKALAGFKAANGRFEELLDSDWEDFEEARVPIARLTAFESMVRHLAAGLDPETTCAAFLDGGESLRGRIQRLAALLATGRTEEAEREMAAAVEQPELRFLYPMLVSLARLRADRVQALAYLRQLRQVHPGTEGSRVRTSIGSLSEREALAAEIGSLLLQEGDEAGALAEWEELRDDSSPDSLLTLAKLHEEHGRTEDALRLLEAWIERTGQRDFDKLSWQARLYQELGDDESADGYLAQAAILAEGDGDHRQEVLEARVACARRLARLPEFLDRQIAEAERDPDDLALQRILAKILLQERRPEQAVAILERLAERPGEAPNAFDMLIARFEATGDGERLRQTLEEFLGTPGIDQWQKQEAARKLSGIHALAGRMEDAVAALRRAFEDEDSAEALAGVASFFAERGDLEQALEYRLQAHEADRKDVFQLVAIGSLLVKLDRRQEALDWYLEFLDHPLGAAALPQYRATVRERLEECQRQQEWEAVLAADPEDPKALYRCGLFDLYCGRFDLAAGRFAKTVEIKKNHLGGRYGLFLAHWNAGRLDQALEAGRAALDLTVRLEGELGQLSGLRTSLVRNLAGLMLERGQKEEAVQLLVSPPQPAFQNYRIYNYGIYNIENLNRELRGQALLRHGLFDQALSRLRVEAEQDRWGRGPFRSLVRTMFLAGEGESAYRLLLSRQLKPAAALIDLQVDGRFRSIGRLDSSASLLIGFARSQGHGPELVALLRDEVEARPENLNASLLLLEVLTGLERWEELCTLLEQRLEQEPGNQDLMERRAVGLKKLGRHDEEQALLRELLEIYGGQGIQGRQWVDSGGRGKDKEVRFRWGAATGFGSSSSFSSRYSTSGGTSTEKLRSTQTRLAALAFRAGDREEGLEREEEALSKVSSWDYRRSRTSQYPQLISIYLEYGLRAEIERLSEELTAADQESLALQNLEKLYRQLGDPEALAGVLARRAELIDQEVAEAPWSIGPLRNRSWLRIRNRIGLDQVEADLRRIEELDPLSPDPGVLRAWLMLRRADAGAALAAFQEAEKLRLRRGNSEDANLAFGLGLAQLAAGDPEQGARLLRWTLLEQDTHHFAEEARAALASLQ